MKKIMVLVIWALVVLGLSSCGREKLTPMYDPITVNELNNEKPINFSYKVDETQIDEYGKNAAKFPIFGRLFKAVAIVLANSKISQEGGLDLELSATDVDLSSMAAIDYDFIQYINFDGLVLLVEEAKSTDSLKFIDRLELYARLDSPVPGLPVDDQGYSKILYYDRSVDSLGCNGHCLKLNIANVNWKQLLMTNKIVHLQPKLVINSVPRSTMKLAGSVEFSVKFNVGF
ncbi:MAG: hypothetical protein EHM20_03045 [Alphaproteobacteria bacterium]|nr:MAG: hypothetical protein EHM20_03045 [Alphaproteobacteria bacterium]